MSTEYTGRGVRQTIALLRYGKSPAGGRRCIAVERTTDTASEIAPSYLPRIAARGPIHRATEASVVVEVIDREIAAVSAEIIVVGERTSRHVAGAVVEHRADHAAAITTLTGSRQIDRRQATEQISDLPWRARRGQFSVKEARIRREEGIAV